MSETTELTPYELWGFETCGHCSKLKTYLRAHAIPYQWIAVPDPAERQARYKEWAAETPFDAPPPSSMPMLRAHGVCLGGNLAVRAMPIEWLRGLLPGFKPEQSRSNRTS